MRELGRKAFHLLTLVLLLAWLKLPQPLVWLWAWTGFIALFEGIRLVSPAANRVFTRPFAGIIREEERDRASGILHTSLGAALVATFFGSHRDIVIGSFLCLAFADAAAALAGRRFGSRIWNIGGKSKSLEGTFACFLAALVSLLCAGFPLFTAAVGALVCAVVEAAPGPFDDNALLPVATAVTLRLLSG